VAVLQVAKSFTFQLLDIGQNCTVTQQESRQKLYSRPLDVSNTQEILHSYPANRRVTRVMPTATASSVKPQHKGWLPYPEQQLSLYITSSPFASPLGCIIESCFI
jgi:hypothetical protein